jgi:hypothetical protein
VYAQAGTGAVPAPGGALVHGQGLGRGALARPLCASRGVVPPTRDHPAVQQDHGRSRGLGPAPTSRGHRPQGGSCGFQPLPVRPRALQGPWTGPDVAGPPPAGRLRPLKTEAQPQASLRTVAPAFVVFRRGGRKPERRARQEHSGVASWPTAAPLAVRRHYELLPPGPQSSVVASQARRPDAGARRQRPCRTPRPAPLPAQAPSGPRTAAGTSGVSSRRALR